MIPSAAVQRLRKVQLCSQVMIFHFEQQCDGERVCVYETELFEMINYLVSLEHNVSN